MVKLVAESFDLGGKLFGNFAILFCIAFTTDRAQQFGIASNTYGCFYRKIDIVRQMPCKIVGAKLICGMQTVVHKVINPFRSQVCVLRKK